MRRSEETPSVKVEKLRKVYGHGETEVRALDGVSLEFLRGEFAAIMGASGSGKSTLLHLVGGLDQPTSGEIEVGGVPLSGLSDRRLTLLRRERMGFIFQFFNLIPTLSAEENMLLPVLISGQKPAEHGDRLEELLRLVGLKDRRGHRPDELSGGEQQRVAIARALLRSPDIILADEPTGNLDSRTGGEILDLLRRATEDYGQTVIMVTHDAHAAAYAERVTFLSDGRVAGEAKDPTPDELLERIKTLESTEG
jgi:putative ABC transport system ATP-binding protein